MHPRAGEWRYVRKQGAAAGIWNSTILRLLTGAPRVERQWWKSAGQCIATLSPRDLGKLKSTVNLVAKCPECIEDLAMAVSAILDGR